MVSAMQKLDNPVYSSLRNAETITMCPARFFYTESYWNHYISFYGFSFAESIYKFTESWILTETRISFVYGFSNAETI